MMGAPSRGQGGREVQKQAAKERMRVSHEGKGRGWSSAGVGRRQWDPLHGV